MGNKSLVTSGFYNKIINSFIGCVGPSKPMHWPTTYKIFLGCFLILLCISPLQAASLGEIQAFGGKVQLQREGQRVWDRANKKDTIQGGDLIKTGYKSFAILKIGQRNKIVMGSSTHALFEKIPGTEQKIKITLFEGGLYFTWPEETPTEIFTNDGLFQVQTGAFAALYSKQDKKTLFANLDGTQSIQSLIKKEPLSLGPSQFSITESEQNPTPPAQISNSVAEQLRLFFGDNFLNKEFEKYKVVIGTESQLSAQATLSDKKETPYEESIRVAPFFNIQDVLKKIRVIEGLETQMYQPPFWYDDQQSYKGFLELKFRMLNLTTPLVESSNPFGLILRSGMRRDNWAFAINYPVETGEDGSLRFFSISSTQAILDKIYFLDYQNSKGNLVVHFGPIRDLTLGKGLLVYRFSNEIKGQIEQPLGFMLQYNPHPYIDFLAFIPDLSQKYITGAHLNFDNGWTQIGGSFVMDWNQGEAFTFADKAFRADALPQDSLLIPSTTGSVMGWELMSQFNFIEEDGLSAYGYAGISVLQASGKVQGVVMQIPAINIIWHRLSTYLEGILTFDYNHWGYFNEYYLEDRARIYGRSTNTSDSLNPADSIYAFSAVELHPPLALSKGFRMGVEWQIMDRLWLGLGYGQTFANSYTAETYTSRNDSIVVPYIYLDSAGTYQFGRTKADTTFADTTVLIPLDQRPHYKRVNWNHNIQFRVFAGNDLISNLKRFEIYYNLHGGWFGREVYIGNEYRQGLNSLPYVDKAGESFYLSLGSTFGMLLEYQILSKSSILAEFRGYSQDFRSNNIFDTDDLIMEFGLSWRSNF